MAGFSAVLSDGEAYSIERIVGGQGLFVSVNPGDESCDVDIETKSADDPDSAYEQIAPFEVFGPVSVSGCKRTFETAQTDRVCRINITNTTGGEMTVKGRSQSVETDEWLLLDGAESFRERLGADRVVIGPQSERDIRFDSVLDSLVVVEHE